jgi:2-polyprenyl-6-methoxyphenol hydroxylase-like FAD-dependent oxidoreductase
MDGPVIMTESEADVLIVGAGPTGLTLALQLAAYGVRPRLVDRGQDRVHESRALAIQPRTLEVLAGSGVTDELLAVGNRAVRLRMHVRGRVLAVPLFDLGLPDTAYPHLLFLSQAETERVLEEHLATAGVVVERRVELVDLRTTADTAVATLRRHDRSDETVSARYVVGCDGARSTVRRLAGIPFQGGSYPQIFVLADVDADGIEPGAAHVFLSERGMLFLFPLGTPATWRLLAMRPPTDPAPPDAPVTLGEVQVLTDAYAGGTVRLRDPVWMTNFRLHHKAAAHYRTGPVFLAGDAAHIHSPAGGQGMNTGIQDAVDLAWKLAYALHGVADPGVLDTYEPERLPVGATVLRFTGRAFTIATSANPIVRFARTRIAPAVLPLVLKPKATRAYAFRTVSQLAIDYRNSPLSVNGPNPPRRGPKAGDRLPDAQLVHKGQSTTLQRATAAPGWHLLLCGPPDGWPGEDVTRLGEHRAGMIAVHQLTAQNAAGALHRLGLTAHDTAQYLIRPDGHVGYRAGGTDLTGLTRYLDRWLPAPRPGTG